MMKKKKKLQAQKVKNSPNREKHDQIKIQFFNKKSQIGNNQNPESIVQ